MTMKAYQSLLIAAALPFLWSCSGDDDDASPQAEEQQTATGTSTFTATTEQPSWAVDWSGNAAAPSWQNPAGNIYDCRMNLFLTLDREMAAYSSDDDLMSVFMKGTCRAVSERNVIEDDGSVVFLPSILGTSEETGEDITLNYYCARLRRIFTIDHLPIFEPNEGFEDEYNIVLDFVNANSKYPSVTFVDVFLPDNPPYAQIKDDAVYFFIDGECRGVCPAYERGEGFKGVVYSYRDGEQAEVRYYSAARQGFYTLQQPVTLNNTSMKIYFAY